MPDFFALMLHVWMEQSLMNFQFNLLSISQQIQTIHEPISCRRLMPLFQLTSIKSLLYYAHAMCKTDLSRQEQ